MTDKNSNITGVAGRYATALYELAAEQKSVADVEAALAAIGALIDESDDLQRLIESPVFSADDQQAAIGAVMDKAGVSGLVGNFVRVVAGNRRLFALPGMIRSFKLIAARERGEQSAQVVSAKKLTAGQEKALAQSLKEAIGKDVSIDASVDPSLIGGLVVRVGSRQIDTSVRTKLNSLKIALKEVG